MTLTQPKTRIKYTEKELERLRGDVDDWKKDRDDLADDCWAWEELIAKTSFLFDRIVDLDSDAQAKILDDRLPFNPELDSEVTKLYVDWIKIGGDLICQIRRLRGTYGAVSGADRLLRQCEEAEAVMASRGIEGEILPHEELAPKALGNPCPERYGW